MSLRSKSIKRMDSSILNVFEPKFSIKNFHTTLTCIIFSNFAHHVDILLQSDFEKKPHVLTKKMPISFFTFVLPISTTISSFKTQTSLKFFPQYQSYHLLFAYFFSQNIVQNPQIKLRKTETKHLKRITFFPPFVTKVSTHLKSKNFLSSSKSFFVFTYPRILRACR